MRYEHRGKRAYGLLEQDTIREIRGGLFGAKTPTGTKVKLAEGKLLYPCEPTTVLAVGLNYKSHLGTRPAPTKPELFFKPLTSLVEPNGEIILSGILVHQAENVIEAAQAKGLKRSDQRQMGDWVALSLAGCRRKGHWADKLG